MQLSDVLESRMLSAGDGVRLRTWTNTVPTADAPIIVFVHGVLASSRYMLPTARLFAPYYRVYVPDLPGYGRSDKPHVRLSTEYLAETLAEWMYVNNLSFVTMLANSYGCQIGARLALHHPDLVNRMVLVGPTVDSQARTFWQQASRLAVDSLLERHSLVLVLIADVIDMGIRRAVAAVRAMLADRIEEALPGLNMPVLVVRGERDPIATARWVEEISRLLPRGQVMTIPGVAHATNYSASQALMLVTEDFINSTPNCQHTRRHPVS